MEYQLIFDIVDQPPIRPWLFFQIFILVVFWPLYANLRGRKLSNYKNENVENKRPNLYLIFLVIFSASVALDTYLSISTHYRLLNSTPSYVEGEITEFKSAGIGKRELEGFCVSKKCFTYRYFNSKGGFNELRILGGKIVNKKYAKILYVNETIVRLEIAK